MPPPSSAPPVQASTQVTVYETPSGPVDMPRPQVLVLVDRHIDRATEVLGILDFHSEASDEDKGFDELRARAFALGADAVLSAEFEHGPDGGPSHLSGIAVRFLEP